MLLPFCLTLRNYANKSSSGTRTWTRERKRDRERKREREGERELVQQSPKHFLFIALTESVFDKHASYFCFVSVVVCDHRG